MNAAWIYPLASGLVFGSVFVAFLWWRRAGAPPPTPEAAPKRQGPADLESIQASLDRIEQRLDAVERALEVKQEAV